MVVGLQETIIILRGASLRKALSASGAQPMRGGSMIATSMRWPESTSSAAASSAFLR